MGLWRVRVWCALSPRRSAVGCGLLVGWLLVFWVAWSVVCWLVRGLLSFAGWLAGWFVGWLVGWLVDVWVGFVGQLECAHVLQHVVCWPGTMLHVVWYCCIVRVCMCVCVCVCVCACMCSHCKRLGGFYKRFSLPF